MRPAQRPDIRSRGGAKDTLERRLALRGTGFQQGEDAAPVVIDHDDGQIRALLMRADEEGVRVVEEGQVADEREAGHSPSRTGLVTHGESDPDRRGQHAVDPGEATVSDDLHPVGEPGGAKVEVPDRV